MPSPKPAKTQTRKPKARGKQASWKWDTYYSEGREETWSVRGLQVAGNLLSQFQNLRKQAGLMNVIGEAVASYILNYKILGMNVLNS